MCLGVSVPKGFRVVGAVSLSTSASLPTQLFAARTEAGFSPAPPGCCPSGVSRQTGARPCPRAPGAALRSQPQAFMAGSALGAEGGALTGRRRASHSPSLSWDRCWAATKPRARAGSSHSPKDIAQDSHDTTRKSQTLRAQTLVPAPWATIPGAQGLPPDPYSIAADFQPALDLVQLPEGWRKDLTQRTEP